MRVDGLHAWPAANHRSQELPDRHARGMEDRRVDPVVGDELAPASLGVSDIAADGEGSLHAPAAQRVATDHDAHLEHAR